MEKTEPAEEAVEKSQETEETTQTVEAVAEVSQENTPAPVEVAEEIVEVEEPAKPVAQVKAPAKEDTISKTAKTPVKKSQYAYVTVARVDILSAMKFSFMLSVALGVCLVIVMAIVWFMLDSMHIFSAIQTFVGNVNSATKLVEYLYFSRFMALVTLVAISNIVVTTVIGAICAYIYNLIGALVGGLKVTLVDE